MGLIPVGLIPVDLTLVSALGRGVLARIPVDPDPPTAREWLRRVLAGAEYQRARPSLGDLIRDAILRWLDDLTVPSAPGGPPALLVFIPVALVLIGVITAFVVYGVPRLRRRQQERGDLFGEDDARSAAAIRRDAAAAARAGDWSLAVMEQFRALSRALADRTVVSISPGTTAYGVARRAGEVFPASAGGLGAGAEAFDRVRYLGGEGTRQDYDRMVALDRELEAARPRLAEAGVGAIGGDPGADRGDR